MSGIDEQIAQWRSAVMRGRAVDAADADELEGHLREQIADLETAGMTEDEAFLIAVRRLGQVDKITAEFAREHSDRLWKQLTMSGGDDPRPRPVLTMLGFAALAAVLIQLVRLWLVSPGVEVFDIPVIGASFAVLPVLAAYFAVVRRLAWRWAVGVAVIVVAVAVTLALFPFSADSATGIVVAIHLPVLLWFAVGVAYLGGEVTSSARRMDFIRFSGEWLIYFALIALGGIVLMGLTVALLTPIAPDAIDGVVTWVVPSGAAGAVIVAAWLVESKKSIIENLAPVLTAIFTPLFAAMLVVAAAVYVIGGIGRDFDRNLLVVFDLLMLVVLGLVVYGISARSGRRPGAMAVIQLVAVIAAILLDVLVLVSMFARVGEFGFTANRVAALGLNLILLVNLAGTAWLSLRVLTGRGQPSRLERWQTDYLPVFGGWAALMVLALPPVFGFA